MKKNRYSRALKVLKSTELDEKIQRLNETPTNNMSGVYALNDPGFRVGVPDPPKVYYPDVDGNWPAGIPGTPGELSYTRPEGYWSGGSDWDQQIQTDFSQDYLLEDPTGKSTAGLIADNGTVLAKLPPGGEAFILGPVVDGFVPNHTSDAYTNIGYIQKDTRQFVLLARISGQWKSNLNGSYPVWGGTSTGFTAYNANFTLAMAQWIRDEILADRYSSNVPYFYSGGVPQVPQSAADCPNCPPGMYGGKGVGGAPFGKGGNPSIGSKQGNPKKGGPGDANLWGVDAKGKKKKLSAADYAAYKAGGGDAATKKGKSIEDVIAQGKKNLGKYDSGQKISDPYKLSSSEKNYLNNIAKTQGAVAARDAQINIEISKLQKLDSAGKLSPQQKLDLIALQANVGLKKASDYAKVASDVLGTVMLAKSAGQLAGKGISAGVSAAVKAGAPKGLSSSGLQVGATGVSKPGFDALTKGVPFKPSSKPQILGQGAYQAPKVGATGGIGGGTGAARYAGAQGSLGGSQQPGGVVGSLTPKGSAKIPIIEPQSKVSATTFDKGAKIVRDVQSGKYPTSAKAQQIQKQLGAAGFPKGQSSIPYSELPKVTGTGKSGVAGATVGAGLGAAGLDAGAAKGQVSQDIINKGNTNPDSLTNKELDAYINYLKTQSPSQSSGAKPQSFDTLNKISPEPTGVDNLINKLTNATPGSSKESTLKKDAVKILDKLDPSSPKYNQLLNLLSGPKGLKESGILSESRQRILREIKKPVVVETQTQKLKNYRPNFAGKYTPQNTPDVTASKQSDEMVKAKNAAGQSWRSQDKYWKGYETVERMNIIYDNVGHGSQYWDMIVNENQSKKTQRDREVQEHLNIIAHEKAMIRENPQYESPFQTSLKEQETLQADTDPLFKKVSKRLKKEIDYPDKPAKAGYPNDPPPKMVNGFHPEYGQKDPYYNKLDPHSANAMPPTGNPKIDAKVEKAKRIKKIIKGS